jgi:hypothetical protein
LAAPRIRTSGKERRVRAEQDVRGHHVRANVAIAAGEAVLVLDGIETAEPSRHSVQVGEGVHVDLPLLAHQEYLARYPWRYTNHSCDPNTVLRGRTLVARWPIAAGDEVTFDYETTEFEMAEPFACHCGSRRCAGMIRGFAFLTADERERRRPLLAPHLLALLDR